MRRLCTGRRSSAAAGTHPVRPLGRPGTLMRYQVGFPVFLLSTFESARTYCGRKSERNWLSTATRRAVELGFARTARRCQLIVPEPTTSTNDARSAPAPAPGASARAAASVSAAPASAWSQLFLATVATVTAALLD